MRLRLNPHPAGQLALNIPQVTDEPLRYFRPPQGHYNDAVLAELGKRGLSNIMWSYSMQDYGSVTQATVWSRFEKHINSYDPSGPGLISVQHFSSGPGTSGLLRRMAAHARARGWEFVTLDECLGAVPAPPRPKLSDAEKQALRDAAHPSKWPAPKTTSAGRVWAMAGKY